MDNYWEQRYRGEGKIWGDTPSVTAGYACRRFLDKGVKSVFIPGIGYGRNARAFIAESMSVTGVEVSGEAARILRHDLPGVNCSEGSALDFPFGGPHDAIYCFNVLHLFRAEDRRTFLRKCLDALADGGLAFFTVFSETEPSYGKGAEVEPGTYESKPGRPVHYFTDESLRSELGEFIVLETGLTEDPENHGAEGPHVHVLRYALAQKRSIGFDGKKYREVSGHQKDWGNKVISGLSLRGDERILDLGCGDGSLSARLAGLVPGGSVLGVDASESMIETAGALKRDNLSFVRLDINYLDFDSEFDVVFSNATLHWIPDHERLLKSVSRSLKRGGYVRFNFGGAGNCPNFIAVIKEATARPEFSAYFKDLVWPWYMPEAGEYEKLVRSHFTDARVWVENADRFFTKDEMTGFVEQPSILPFLRYVDESDQSRFRDFVVGRVLERTKQEDDKYFEEFRRINVFARKD